MDELPVRNPSPRVGDGTRRPDDGRGPGSDPGGTDHGRRGASLMPDFVTRLADGWRRALDHATLALVPVVLALLSADEVRAVLSFDGVHVGLKLGAPVSVVTVWQFVSTPKSGVDVDPGVPLEVLPFVAVTVPLLLAVKAALAAGYFGSVRNALADEPYDFVGNVRRHFVPFLLLTALPALVLLPVALGAVGVGAATGSVGSAGVALLVVALPAYVAVAYLFAATPYLIVLRDAGLVDAARASSALAVEGGPYLRYMVGFAAFVLVVSPLATAFVVNVPVVGLVAGVGGGGVLGLAANVTTMRFVAEIDDPGSASSVGD